MVLRKCSSVQGRLEEAPDRKRMEMMVNHRLKQSSRRQISQFRSTVEIVATLQNAVRHTTSFHPNSTGVRVELFRLSVFLYVHSCIHSVGLFPCLIQKRLHQEQSKTPSRLVLAPIVFDTIWATPTYECKSDAVTTDGSVKNCSDAWRPDNVLRWSYTVHQWWLLMMTATPRQK